MLAHTLKISDRIPKPQPYLFFPTLEELYLQRQATFDIEGAAIGMSGRGYASTAYAAFGLSQGVFKYR
jgi:hypothetical protein